MASAAEVPKLLLWTREVARALGVSERFVKGLIHTGSLRSLKVGRLRQVYADDLRDWIEHQRTATSPLAPRHTADPTPRSRERQGWDGASSGIRAQPAAMLVADPSSNAAGRSGTPAATVGPRAERTAANAARVGATSPQ